MQKLNIFFISQGRYKSLSFSKKLIIFMQILD